MITQKKVDEFFQSHPDANEVHFALGYLFPEKDRAESFIAGTKDQRVITFFRDGKSEIVMPKAKTEGEPLSEEEVEAGMSKAFIAEETKEPVIEHTITEQDLKDNPELVEQGIKVGEEILIPDESETEKLKEAVSKNTVKKSEGKKSAKIVKPGKK